jgi:hypothetical protein
LVKTLVLMVFRDYHIRRRWSTTMTFTHWMTRYLIIWCLLFLNRFLFHLSTFHYDVLSLFHGLILFFL